VTLGGGEQPVVGIGLQKQAGQAIASTVDQAHSVVLSSEQGTSFGDGGIKKLAHVR
jgi:hypothetical protein